MQTEKNDDFLKSCNYYDVKVLIKYKQYFDRLETLKQEEIEALIIFLENEISNEELSEYGLVSNWINLIKKIQLRIILTEEEKKAINDFKTGNYFLPKELCKDEKKDKKILNMINK